MGKKKPKKSGKESKTVSEVVHPGKVRDYIRQLSIVVLGIVVTFVGSHLISDYSRQREIRSLMLLIKSELERNREELSGAEELIVRANRMAILLEASDFEVQSIPEDTLARGMVLLNKLSSYTVSAEAMDVLKTSGMMQHVSDKQFVLLLTQTYQGLKNMQQGIDAYYKLKGDALFPIVLRMDTRNKERMGDPKAFYQTMLSYDEMKNFVLISPGFLDEDTFPNTRRKIEESIRYIERKYE